MKNILSKILLVFMVLGAIMFVAPTSSVYACNLVVDATTGEWVDASGAVKSVTDARAAKCLQDADELGGKILRFVKIISTLVVMFAVGIIIYAGFKYVTSQGDPKQAEEAKTQIWYAGVGLFIVIVAFTILQLFINASGGAF